RAVGIDIFEEGEAEEVRRRILSIIKSDGQTLHSRIADIGQHASISESCKRYHAVRATPTKALPALSRKVEVGWRRVAGEKIDGIRILSYNDVESGCSPIAVRASGVVLVADNVGPGAGTRLPQIVPQFLEFGPFDTLNYGPCRRVAILRACFR